MRSNYKVYLVFLFIFAFYSCSNLDDVNTRLDQLESEFKKKSIPNLLSFGFLAEDNKLQLIEDVKCTIEGDSLIECWIPHIVEDKNLVPNFSFEGDKVFADGIELINHHTIYDFSKPVMLSVKWGGADYLL